MKYLSNSFKNINTVRRILVTLIALVLILLPACSNNAPVEKDVPPLGNVFTAVKEAYGENYLPNISVPEEILESEFGLTSDMYDEVIAEMAMISAFNDRLLLVRAKDGQADSVEKALEDARERKINDALQYPMNMIKSNASRVVRNGNDFAFIILGANYQGSGEDPDEAAIFAEEQTQIGVDAFFAAYE